VPGVGTRADAVSQLPQLSRPLRIGHVLPQSALQCPPGPGKGRTDRGHDSAVPDYDEGLAVGLDAVEDVGEAASRIGGTELFHRIRLSDPHATLCISAHRIT
jgi:hypothetical protein